MDVQEEGSLRRDSVHSTWCQPQAATALPPGCLISPLQQGSPGTTQPQAGTVNGMEKKGERVEAPSMRSESRWAVASPRYEGRLQLGPGCPGPGIYLPSHKAPHYQGSIGAYQIPSPGLTTHNQVP